MNSVVVSGNSMDILFKNHDIILISESKIFHFGDIIVFAYEDKYIIHRILLIIGDNIFQAGDNSIRGEWIKKSSIIGVANYILCIESDNVVKSLSCSNLNRKCALISLLLLTCRKLKHEKNKKLFTGYLIDKLFLKIILYRNNLQIKYKFLSIKEKEN